ncbi:MAG: TlpA family protein disulfide reductase [Endomicrobium sp.]|uniref:TlpA family protein disulfide reductase n=1 Tax=Candidatus Endomicrobiellum pyrsonymphae TaxID=1408203 RepID=UPI003582102A|nr:TlpA family protein disulfide reductase [Endomicrobium sp.]
MFLEKMYLVAFVVCFMLGAVFAEKAPDFSLKDVNGIVFNLSAYKGKIVFLDFWTTWCPPCRVAIPAVKELHKTKATNPNVIVLGINVNEKQSTVERFVKSNGINYNVLLGNDQICKDYKVNAFPLFLIIDTNGEIIARYVGYSPGLEKEWGNAIDKLIK